MRAVCKWFDDGCREMKADPELVLIGLVWSVWFLIVVLVLMKGGS